MNGSIRRRSKNSWELTIDLGHDAGGKRKRKYVSVKGTKKLAEQKLRELLSATDKGIPIDSRKITLGEWLQKWMDEYVVPTKSQKTRERYGGVIKNHVAPMLGRIELSKVTPGDIRSFEANLTVKGMAPAGVQLVHAIISGAYKYALKDDNGYAWRNPAKAVTPPKIVRKEVEPPEIAKVREILELACSSPPIPTDLMTILETKPDGF